MAVGCNQGSYAGNAAGFKVTSLDKISETKSNKPSLTLLHHMVQKAEEQNPHILKFIDELMPLLKVTERLMLGGPQRKIKKEDELDEDHGLLKEVDHLKESVGQLKELTKKGDGEVKQQFKEFIKVGRLSRGLQSY